MDELLTKVKQNLILEHSADDELIKGFITAAVSYAESYQHLSENYYSENAMPPTTEQAVIMLSSHFTNRGTAVQAVFSEIMFRRGNRCGIR